MALALLTSCASAKRAEVDWNETYIGSFPYHPLLYHLDLSTLSYQLYAQTLVWPFDPYYEELSNWANDRAKYMKKVRSWAQEHGPEQVRRPAGLSGYRGPGVLGGFEDNPFHPTRSSSRKLKPNPWKSVLTAGVASMPSLAGRCAQESTKTLTG